MQTNVLTTSSKSCIIQALPTICPGVKKAGDTYPIGPLRKSEGRIVQNVMSVNANDETPQRLVKKNVVHQPECPTVLKAMHSESGGRSGEVDSSQSLVVAVIVHTSFRSIVIPQSLYAPPECVLSASQRLLQPGSGGGPLGLGGNCRR